MNTKLRKQLRQRKLKLDKRIDKSAGFSESRIRGGKVKYELSERQQAVACGGLGIILQMVSELKLRQQINRAAPIFKFYAPYDETDHILNIALNLLSGGTCLDHLEFRRTDEAYLDALGSRRIPDPTTAGDFCRRFSDVQILQVMQALNRVRQTVWRQQPDSFFDQATIEADGTMVETRAEKKDGIGINHKGEWGYHPLVVSLDSRCEPALQPREHDQPVEGQSLFDGTAERLDEQLGLHGLRVAGLDAQAMERLDGSCARQSKPTRETGAPSQLGDPDGVRDVPQLVDPDSSPSASLLAADNIPFVKLSPNSRKPTPHPPTPRAAAPALATVIQKPKSGCFGTLKRPTQKKITPAKTKTQNDNSGHPLRSRCANAKSKNTPKPQSADA